MNLSVYVSSEIVGHTERAGKSIEKKRYRPRIVGTGFICIYDDFFSFYPWREGRSSRFFLFACRLLRHCKNGGLHILGCENRERYTRLLLFCKTFKEIGTFPTGNLSICRIYIYVKVCARTNCIYIHCTSYTPNK